MGRRIGGLLLLGGLLVAYNCGGGGDTAGPLGTSRDGRIFVENSTPEDLRCTIWVNYVDEEEGFVEIQVERGERKELTRRPLKGGTKVALHVRAFTRRAYAPPSTVKRDIEVTIGGNITFKVTFVGLEGSNRMDYVLLTE